MMLSTWRWFSSLPSARAADSILAEDCGCSPGVECSQKDVCVVSAGPHIVNWSMLLGAILSWGIMWPLMETRAGDW
jgi:hypothetical protein